MENTVWVHVFFWVRRRLALLELLNNTFLYAEKGKRVWGRKRETPWPAAQVMIAEQRLCVCVCSLYQMRVDSQALRAFWEHYVCNSLPYKQDVSPGSCPSANCSSFYVRTDTHTLQCVRVGFFFLLFFSLLSSSLFPELEHSVYGVSESCMIAKYQMYAGHWMNSEVLMLTMPSVSSELVGLSNSNSCFSKSWAIALWTNSYCSWEREGGKNPSTHTHMSTLFKSVLTFRQRP